MKNLSPQQLNFEAFRCELRVMPEYVVDDYENKLAQIDTLPPEEQQLVALQYFFDKSQDKKERTVRAMQIWQKLNTADSLFYLATAYFLTNHEDKAVEYLKQSAKLGNLDAYLRVGYCYLMGISVPLDLKKACSIFKKLAEKDVPDAIYFMGALYLIDVDFITKNKEKSRELLLSSVEKGSKFALFEHGVSLLRKEETKAEGLEYIIQAAQKQEVRAMLFLSVEYSRGTLVPQNLQLAQIYLEKCCHLNFRPALQAIKEATTENNEEN